MKLFFVLIILLAALPAWLLAANGDVAAGQAVFSKSCKVCHGPQGHGNAAIAKALNTTIADLASKDVQARTDDDLKKAITEGKGKMKPIKTLSGGEMRDLMAFVRTLAAK